MHEATVRVSGAGACVRTAGGADEPSPRGLGGVFIFNAAVGRGGPVRAAAIGPRARRRGPRCGGAPWTRRSGAARAHTHTHSHARKRAHAHSPQTPEQRASELSQTHADARTTRTHTHQAEERQTQQPRLNSCPAGGWFTPSGHVAAVHGGRTGSGFRSARDCGGRGPRATSSVLVQFRLVEWSRL